MVRSNSRMEVRCFAYGLFVMNWIFLLFSTLRLMYLKKYQGMDLTIPISHLKSFSSFRSTSNFKISSLFASSSSSILMTFLYPLANNVHTHPFANLRVLKRVEAKHYQQETQVEEIYSNLVRIMS